MAGFGRARVCPRQTGLARRRRGGGQHTDLRRGDGYLARKIGERQESAARLRSADVVGFQLGGKGAHTRHRIAVSTVPAFLLKGNNPRRSTPRTSAVCVVCLGSGRSTPSEGLMACGHWLPPEHGGQAHFPFLQFRMMLSVLPNRKSRKRSNRLGLSRSPLPVQTENNWHASDGIVTRFEALRRGYLMIDCRIIALLTCWAHVDA